MIFGKTKLELKVGIFVFVGVIILSAFVLSIGKFRTLTSGYRVNFIYNFVNGVKIGAPVRFAGVDVGEVKMIKFIFVPEEQKTKIHIVCWISKDIKIPTDSTIWVNTLGLLGEKYVEIMPGKDYSHCLAANQSLEGVDPVPMHEVFRLGKNIAETINESFMKIRNAEGTVGKLLYDDTIYKELEALVIDVRNHPWKLFWKTKEKPEKK
jgi:phospholipid/cholesterol/gamma-HCH transport system substrate-binding protein